MQAGCNTQSTRADALAGSGCPPSTRPAASITPGPGRSVGCPDLKLDCLYSRLPARVGEPVPGAASRPRASPVRRRPRCRTSRARSSEVTGGEVDAGQLTSSRREQVLGLGEAPAQLVRAGGDQRGLRPPACPPAGQALGERVAGGVGLRAAASTAAGRPARRFVQPGHYLQRVPGRCIPPACTASASRRRSPAAAATPSRRAPPRRQRVAQPRSAAAAGPAPGHHRRSSFSSRYSAGCSGRSGPCRPPAACPAPGAGHVPASVRPSRSIRSTSAGPGAVELEPPPPRAPARQRQRLVISSAGTERSPAFECSM